MRGRCRSLVDRKTPPGGITAGFQGLLEGKWNAIVTSSLYHCSLAYQSPTNGSGNRDARHAKKRNDRACCSPLMARRPFGTLVLGPDTKSMLIWKRSGKQFEKHTPPLNERTRSSLKAAGAPQEKAPPSTSDKKADGLRVPADRDRSFQAIVIIIPAHRDQGFQPIVIAISSDRDRGQRGGTHR